MALFRTNNWNRVRVLFVNAGWGSYIAQDLSKRFVVESWNLDILQFLNDNEAQIRKGLVALKSFCFWGLRQTCCLRSVRPHR